MPDHTLFDAIGGCPYCGHPEEILKSIHDAGYVVVPKPSGDRVQAAADAYLAEWDRTVGQGLDAMRAALAAADAADTRPRELLERLSWLTGYSKRSGLPAAHGYKRAAALVAETFGLEVDGQ